MAFATTEYVTDTFESITDTNGDGSQWDCIYDIKNPNSQFVDFYFNYNQVASAKITIKAFFESARTLDDDTTTVSNLDGEWFQETYLSDTESVGYAVEHAETGKYRIIIPVSFTADKINIQVVPDVASGADTLRIHCDDEGVRGRR